MTKGAVIGGLIAGVLSAIPCVNLGCCVWGLGGGFLAAYLASRISPTDVGEGLKAGALAGAIAGIISGAANAVLQLALHQNPFANLPPEQAEKIPEALRSGGAGVVAIGGAVLFLVTLVVFGLLGGLIGGAVFKPKTAAPTPGM